MSPLISIMIDVKEFGGRWAAFRMGTYSGKQYMMWNIDLFVAYQFQNPKQTGMESVSRIKGEYDVQAAPTKKKETKQIEPATLPTTYKFALTVTSTSPPYCGYWVTSLNSLGIMPWEAATRYNYDANQAFEFDYPNLNPHCHNPLLGWRNAWIVGYILLRSPQIIFFVLYVAFPSLLYRIALL